MRFSHNLSVCFLTLAMVPTLLAKPVDAQVKIVASIKPLHSLAAVATSGVSTPDLIVDGFQSPHTFQLRPSKARLVQNADLVLWVGDRMEGFLAKPLKAFSETSKQLEALSLPALHKLPLREQDSFGDHDHDHDDDEHEEGEQIDPHVWLDPDNAVVIVNALTVRLSEMDPKNSKTYATNAREFAAKMESLKADIFADLSPVRGKAFYVFHDAFHYFEARFDLHAEQAVTPSVEQKPGAKRVRELKNAFSEHSVKCAFTEPQVSQRFLQVAIEGTDVKIGELDALGAGLEAGVDLYPQLLRNMAASLRECLS